MKLLRHIHPLEFPLLGQPLPARLSEPKTRMEMALVGGLLFWTIISASAPTPSFADPAATTAPAQTDATPANPKAAKPEVTETKSSSAENSPSEAPSKLSIRDAILLSIAQNPSFAIVKLGTESAQQEVLSAQSIYDTLLELNAGLSRSRDPSDSALLGSTTNTTAFKGGASLSQKIFSGADLSLNWDNERTENSAPYTSLSPAYRTSLSLGIRQPLLKGTWGGAPNVVIRIASTGAQASKDLFEGQLADQVRSVIATYWNEVRARQLVQVQKNDLELSERLQHDTSEGVRVGQLAPLALSEANAQVALSREQLIVAQNELLDAGRALRQVTGLDFLAAESGSPDYRPLQASDEPKFVPLSFNQDQSVELALSRRAELKAQSQKVKMAELSLRLASNQLLPELDLKGSLGTQGLAGTDRGTSFNFGGTNEPSPFQGGYHDAIDDARSGDYYQYSYGLSFSMPLDNRRARADYNLKEIALHSERHRLRALTQQVIQETLSAVAAVEASTKRVKAAEDAVTYSRESLDVQREKLNAGLATVREVLEVQRDLSRAELRLAEALTDFRTSVADVLRARGELLEHYQLPVEPK